MIEGVTLWFEGAMEQSSDEYTRKPKPASAHHHERDGCQNQKRAKPAAELDEAAEAKRLGLSPVHFRWLFAEHAGLPPHRFLMRTRSIY
jgi:AraC-like DNA-binding protein